MTFCSPEIKESHFNLEQIFKLIEIDIIFKQYDNVIFTGDFKLLNEVYGLMGATSKHPCLYCTSEFQALRAETPRTLGNMRKDNDLWKSSHGSKNTCKLFNNVLNRPLFQSMSDETPPLRLTPPPSLHIMIGIFNAIWKKWRIYLINTKKCVIILQ